MCLLSVEFVNLLLNFMAAMIYKENWRACGCKKSLFFWSLRLINLFCRTCTQRVKWDTLEDKLGTTGAWGPELWLVSSLIHCKLRFCIVICMNYATLSQYIHFYKSSQHFGHIFISKFTYLALILFTSDGCSINTCLDWVFFACCRVFFSGKEGGWATRNIGTTFTE